MPCGFQKIEYYRYVAVIQGAQDDTLSIINNTGGAVVFHVVHISPKTFYHHFTISFAYLLYRDGKKERDLKINQYYQDLIICIAK